MLCPFYFHAQTACVPNLCHVWKAFAATLRSPPPPPLTSPRPAPTSLSCHRLQWQWQPLPAWSGKGLGAKDTSMPAWCATPRIASRHICSWSAACSASAVQQHRVCVCDRWEAGRECLINLWNIQHDATDMPAKLSKCNVHPSTHHSRRRMFAKPYMPLATAILAVAAGHG
jgi:hypothetical protein